MIRIDSSIYELFRERDIYLKKLKQANYEENYEIFRNRYGGLITDAINAMPEEDEEALKAAMSETAGDMAASILSEYGKRNKVSPNTLMDLNFMMIYYIFPFLLKSGEKGESFAAVLKDKWNETLGCNISYAPYEEIMAGFRKKLFGFF